METIKKTQTGTRPTNSGSPLKWEVFVTPGMPIRTADRPADEPLEFRDMRSDLLPCCDLTAQRSRRIRELPNPNRIVFSKIR